MKQIGKEIQINNQGRETLDKKKNLLFVSFLFDFILRFRFARSSLCFWFLTSITERAHSIVVSN